MRSNYLFAGALLVSLAGCAIGKPAGNSGSGEPKVVGTGTKDGISITRLDCGTVKVGDFSKTFSDRQVYAPGPKTLTDSCYLIAHKDQHLLWDAGLPAALKDAPKTEGDFTVSVEKTLAEQLAALGLKPEDVDVVGISHKHFDHTGQAASFAKARLVIGKGDFEESAGKDDPFGPWRGEGKPVTLATGDVDIFGDGSVVALHLPGHTSDHLALLVTLASGPGSAERRSLSRGRSAGEARSSAV